MRADTATVQRGGIDITSRDRDVFCPRPGQTELIRYYGAPSLALGGGGRRASRARRRLCGALLSDDLILNLVVDVLRNDLAVDEIVLSVVGAMRNDRLGARRPDAWQLIKLLGEGRVDIDQPALLLRSGGCLGRTCRFGCSSRRGRGRFGRRCCLRKNRRCDKRTQPNCG